MKISHEVPISLLEESKTFNDYDYILPHLLDKYPAYEAYMRKAKEEGRYLIMDNSLHELGVPYTQERLIYWLDELQPNEFIVPDFWEEADQSYQSAQKWLNLAKTPIQNFWPDTTLVAVVQAKNYGDAARLYGAYKQLGYKKICFSYGAEYYAKLFPHPDKLAAKALGRLQVICKLKSEGWIQPEDRIHLLGCNLPQEFGWYKGINIESIDTSNPIMAGIEGVIYENWGLQEKPKIKIDEVIDKEFNSVTLSIINYNINRFKEINGLK